MAQIDRLPEAALMHDMVAMGLGLTLGAAGLGLAASALRARGVPTTLVFVAACLAYAGVQGLLVWQVTLPAWVPGWLPWSVLAAFGGMTALNYSSPGRALPRRRSGGSTGR